MFQFCYHTPTSEGYCTVSTASRVFPTFQPGFMPATWAAAEMALNFAVEGHVTAVTFPDGSAGVSSALYPPLFGRFTHLVLR